MAPGFFHAFFSGVFPLVFPLQVRNALNVLLHTVRAGLLHLFCDMAVHVQREGGAIVAQVSLHGLDIVPGPDRGHGVAVTQIVESGRWEADGCNDFLVVVVYGAGGQVVAQIIRKHQSGVLPQPPRPEPCRALVGTVSPQDSNHGRGDGNHAPLAVLCGHKVVFSWFAGNVLELLIDKNMPPLQVHAVPSKPQDFPSPHTCEECNQKNRFKRAALNGFQEVGDILTIQGLNLLANGPGYAQLSAGLNRR